MRPTLMDDLLGYHLSEKGSRNRVLLSITAVIIFLSILP